MDLELHQLELRYEELRARQPARERRLLASLAEAGQRVPVVVVDAAGGRYVLVDGYKRVRALRRLQHDVVSAARWELDEADALVLTRLMRAGEADSPLEQGWLLRELSTRFRLDQSELARRFDKSLSWVSRLLGLVGVLPETIQDQVRRGQIGAHAAMKYLLPLARANPADCVTLADAIATLQVSSRQLGALYAAYHDGAAETRALVLADPGLVLRAQEEARRDRARDRGPGPRLIADFAALGQIARRAQVGLRQHAQALLASERDDLRRCALAAWTDLAALWRRLEKELPDDRPEHENRDPQAA